MTSSAPRSGPVGRLYGVGVGPGDPELLTVKAQRVLQSVPVIWVPQAGVSVESYAYGIVKGIIDEDKQEVVRATFPTNDEDAAGEVWRAAARELANRLEAGSDVAFITEGDPMLYSTFFPMYWKPSWMNSPICPWKSFPAYPR